MSAILEEALMVLLLATSHPESPESFTEASLTLPLILLTRFCKIRPFCWGKSEFRLLPPFSN